MPKVYAIFLLEGCEEMIDYKMIGIRIKQARIQKGMTQQQFAEKLDLSVPYISKIETGKAKISLPRLVGISNILGVDEGSLLSGTNVGSCEYLNKELNSIVQEFSPDEKNFAYKMLKEFRDVTRNK